MADSLSDALTPYLTESTKDGRSGGTGGLLRSKYLTRLTGLSLEALQSSEPPSLGQSSHSVTLSLQALANRSSKSIITAADSLATLQTSLPALADESNFLRDAVPQLDEEAVSFSTRYSKTGQNAILDKRKQAMLLARNVDRLSDILELPTLLATAISSSSVTTSSVSNTVGANYSSALDLFAHIKRLQILYPSSTVVQSVLSEAEEAMKEMASNLITSLRSQQNIRLAAAMRTIGWLRRVIPDLASTEQDASRKTKSTTGQVEGSFGALFLVCRLANLMSMLEALAPLRDLADQESLRRQQQSGQLPIGKGDGSRPAMPRGRGELQFSGQQSERYLKRYIEIFREQVFATVSMYKNIFPAEGSEQGEEEADGLMAPPPALQTFPLYLADVLTDTLKTYLPNIRDEGARESLLTQVLYTAGSLGRLGADFGLMIALLEDEIDDGMLMERHSTEKEGDMAVPEWQQVMKKHRIQAGRLEALASGHGLT